MSLTPNYKIESKDIKLQSIEQYSEIIHDQLDTNYYYFNSPQSQSKDTVVYPPLLKSYAINKDGGEGSITGHREYTVSDESQSITYTAVPKEGWDISSFKVDWSVTQGSAYFSSTTSNPTVLEIPEKTYGGIGIKCRWTALPASLTIGGGWSNTQFTGQSVDPTGLTFTVTYGDGSTASKIASQLSISPSTWSSTVGTQIATFSYTENGKTVSASKSASVVAPWTAQTITLTNPNSSLVFRSISGNLYTNSACTTKASTNTKYTGTTFYYKSNETKPTGSYIYNYGDGYASLSEPSKDTITTYYNEGSLTTCLGTDECCWSGTRDSDYGYYKIDLSNGSWEVDYFVSYSWLRIRESSF